MELEKQAWFRQLAIIKQRLETYPMASHEAKVIRDSLIIVIRTIAGEELDLSGIGGERASLASPGEHITVGDQVLRGGREVAPGVVVYEPDQSQALENISENLGATVEQPPEAQAEPANGITPLPGSLMAQALGGKK